MLKPKWLGLLAVLVAIMVSFTFLGLWQLSVARDDALKAELESAASRPVVPLTSVIAPHQPFTADLSGRPVTATGRYDAAGQVLVVDRRLDDVGGSWVVTPLVVDGTGARLAILRGFLPGDPATQGSGPAPAADGPVTVTGTLAPAESPTTTSTPLADGQLASVDLARLVNEWDGSIYNAFAFATSETPDQTDGTLARVPPPPLPSGLTWRNAAYAVQWWVFALFAAWMWWRMVRDDHRRSLATPGASAASAAAPSSQPHTAGAAPS